MDDKGVAGRNASFERGKASFVGIMADVPKPKPQHGGKGDNKKKSRLIRGVVTSEDIRRVMKEGRSMDESKKRFWSFFSDNMEGTRACLETVFEAERKTDVMKDFFQKHKFCVSRFTEETVAVLNMWTTEVHLSFYCLTSAVENESCAAASKPEKLLSLPVAGGGAIGKL